MWKTPWKSLNIKRLRTTLPERGSLGTRALTQRISVMRN
jgi:hypothetical protein